MPYYRQTDKYCTSRFLALSIMLFTGWLFGCGPVSSVSTSTTTQTIDTYGCDIVSTANSVCVGKYNASGWIESTYHATTTASSGSTSTTLSSTCAQMGFDATTAGTQYGHQGVSIAGAGTAGDFYVGTATGCTGTTLTLSPATTTAVTNAAVHHDETVAVLAALSDVVAAGGGNVNFPSGYYRVNGPLQDTSHANAVIDMPNIAYGLSSGTQTTPMAISFIGIVHPTLGCVNGCTVLETDRASGNLIGGYYSGGLFPFTYVSLDLESIALRTYPQSGTVLMNGTNISSLQLHNVTCDVGDNSSAFNTNPLPANKSQACALFPTQQNNVENIVDDLWFLNMYTGLSVGEHTHILSAYGADAYNAFVMNGDPLSFAGTNTISADYLWAQTSYHTLTASSLSDVDLVVDSEAIRSGGADVYDPSNLIHGDVFLGTLPHVCSPVLTGGANITFSSSCGYDPVTSISAQPASGSGAIATCVDICTAADGWLKVISGTGATTGVQFVLNLEYAQPHNMHCTWQASAGGPSLDGLGLQDYSGATNNFAFGFATSGPPSSYYIVYVC